MRNNRVTIIVEIALAIALSVVLKAFSISLPILIAGGSISLEMLPIFIVALRRGPLAGVTVGALFGLIDVAIEPYVVHPAQFLLDYPVAFGVVGLSGLGSRAMLRRLSEGATVQAMVFACGWIALGVLGRFAVAFSSGLIFFGSNAPAGQPAWLYSLMYNASYLVPSGLVCAVAFVLITPALYSAVPVAPASRAAV